MKSNQQFGHILVSLASLQQLSSTVTVNDSVWIVQMMQLQHAEVRVILLVGQQEVGEWGAIDHQLFQPPTCFPII